jgi:hypothetical protein
MSNPGGLDFNSTPYYDDYNEDDKYVRILFRPGRAVQARELTQLQTIVQKQIERFGNYFFKEGAVIDGCEQGLDLNLPYIKLQPTYNSAEVNVASFLEKEIVGSETGVTAKVGIVADIEGTDPKTLYVNYTASGTGVLSVNAIPSTLVVGNSIGTANVTATIRYWDTSLLKIFVTDPVGDFEELLAAEEPVDVTTLDNTGAGITMSVEAAVDYREAKEFQNSETIFTKALPEGSRSYATSATTAATSFTSGGKTYNRASKVTVGDGIIYVADHFVKHSNQTILLDKYSNEPTYKIGVVPSKDTVDYIENVELVDNAQGTPNFQAPGADRFKIDTTLTKIAVNEDTAETEFITLMEVEAGSIKKRKTFGIESKIEEVISRRTYEESGDYTLSNPKISIREHLIQGENGGRYSLADGGNTNLLLLEVDPFVAYVKGFRSEFISKQSIELEKGLDVQYVDQNKTQVNYGNYVQVNEFIGSWDLMQSTRISLYSTAFDSITARTFSATTVNSANKIGEARVRSIDYVSGVPGTPSCVYNLFLFDVQMNAGHSFEEVRGIYDSPARYADIVLDENGNAVLRESSFNNVIFELPYDAIRGLRDIDNDIQSGFTFRKEFDINFNSGTATVTSGDNNESFVGTGLLSDTQKNENYFIFPTTDVDCANVDGTISISNGSSTVGGSSTTFVDDFEVGDFIRLGTEIHRISVITNNTSLTIADTYGGTNLSSENVNLVLPAYLPIRMTGRGSNGSTSDRAITVTIPGSTSMTIEIRETAPAFQAKLIATLNRSNAREMKKTLYANQTVQIQANTHPNGLSGPYSLGKSDIYRIKAIYESTSFDIPATSANTDVTGLYTFDNGQRDNTYENGKITPKLGVVPTGALQVVFDYFTHDITQGLGYMSVDSYPIDDVNETSTTINTSEIPVYISRTSGYAYNLRNCLDFRLRKTDSTAATNPPDSDVFQIPVGGLHNPVPFSDFDSSLSLYKGRNARLFLTDRGEFGVVNGSPGYPSPQIPTSIPGTLDLAIVSIPAYPSEPKNVVIEPQKNRRYTMRDIGKIEDRVNRLEYYTSLNLLEKQAAETSIVDENGIDRFKNGILVDPFIGYNVADVNAEDIQTSVNRQEKFATTKIDLNQVPMQFDAALSTGVTRNTGNKVTLSYSTEVFSENPYASSAINLTQDLSYDWTGVMTMYPTTDNWMELVNYPGKNLVVDLEGNADNWRQLTDAWESEHDSWETRWLGVPVLQEAAKAKFPVGRIYDVSADRQYDDISANIKVGPTELQSETRVVDVSVNHYMRSRDFIFSVSGLKPFSKLYAFVDGVNVSSNCKSITLASGKTINDVFNLIDSDGFVATDALTYTSGNTGVLFASSTGEINGIFTLPEQTFFVGQREFKLSDDAQNSETSATTTAKALIVAQGISEIASTSVLNTRPANINFASAIEKTAVQKQSSTAGAAIRNPLSQSFIVDDVNYPYGVFVSSIDVFFKSKSTTGTDKVYMQIREMENGLPTRKAIGDAIAAVSASAITTSEDGTSATTFTFSNPIYLTAGNEYCFSLIPEGNRDNFEVWIAELGAIDLSSTYNQPRIEKQPAAGTLFTSSNDYTWSVRQTQDLKYTIKVATFTENATSYAYLTNKSFDADLNYTSIVPNIAQIRPDNTEISLSVRTADSTSILYEYIDVDNLELVNLNSQKTIVDSAQEVSDEIKSLTYRVTMQTQNKYVTPVIDLERVQTIVYNNAINYDTFISLDGLVSYSSGANTVTGIGTSFTLDLDTGEYVKFGDQYRQILSISSNTSLTVATDFSVSASNVAYTSSNEENPDGPYASLSRYITRRVELADGFEANDLVVYLDVNRPVGTDVKVYYKILNDSDSDSFDTKFYQEMSLEGQRLFNDDQSKYVAEKYVVPNSIKSGGSNLLSGTVDISTSSTTVTGTSTRFLEQLRIGDTIRVDSDYRVVTAIANNTSLTVDSNFSVTALDKEMYKMLYNAIVYTTPDNRTYSGYKYFAIKIVFLSNNVAVAPRVKKLKALALT